MLKNKTYLTNLNVFASFAVVALHTNGKFWEFSSQDYWWRANIIESVFYFAVPIFFMISGATLIDYPERYSTKVFFKRRFQKVGLVYIVWSFLAYLFTKKTVNITHLDFAEFFEGVVNSQINPYYWFFPAIMMIYLSIPLFASIERSKKRTVFGHLIITGFIFNSLFPLLFNVLGLKYHSDWTLGVISNYLIFIIIGYWISHYKISKKYRLLIYYAGIIGLALHLILTYRLSFQEQTIVHQFKGYTNVPSILYATSIFTFFAYSSEKIQLFILKFTKPIRNLTLAIYLIHWFIIQEIIQRSLFDTTDLYFQLFGAVPIFILSFLIIAVLKKVPYVKHLC